jgi:hypothetical protein
MTGGTYIPTQPAVVGLLTDGTGISSLDLGSRAGWLKFIKDLVADVLLSGAAALVAVQIVSVDAAIAAPQVAAFALLGAGIRALYRAVLRWATTP